MIAFDEIRDYTNVGNLLHLNLLTIGYCETPYKIRKKFQIMTSFRTPARVYIIERRIFFSPHIDDMISTIRYDIVESANIAENRQIFSK